MSKKTKKSEEPKETTVESTPVVPTTKEETPNRNYAGRPKRGAPNRAGRSAVALALDLFSGEEYRTVESVTDSLAAEFPEYERRLVKGRVTKLLGAIRRPDSDPKKEANRVGYAVETDGTGFRVVKVA